jgi:hypothetical protein
MNSARLRSAIREPLRRDFKETKLRMSLLSLMTTRPERFRVNAIECYIASQKVKDPEFKEIYLELMRRYRELADQVERIEHSWLDREGIY